MTQIAPCVKSVSGMPQMPPVPQRYLGVWQRLSLENPAGTDTSSRVYWLQTPRLHGDIRVPASRPDYQCNSLHELPRTELLMLARQQGFAGATLVDGDICQWQHHIDYQPPSGNRDIGRMRFENDCLVEEGAESSYREIWQRLPGSTGETMALRFLEEHPLDGFAVPRKGYLLASGDYFIFARDHAAVLPEAPSLAGLIASSALSHEQVVNLLDFEISFGRIRGGRIPLEIQLSTLPFREGQAVLPEAEWAAITRCNGQLLQRVATPQGIVTRRWAG